MAIAILLVLTALPDAMVVPLLKELLVGRYDVGPGDAHAFLSINLVGALCAVPLLGFAARRGRPVLAIGIAAIAGHEAREETPAMGRRRCRPSAK